LIANQHTFIGMCERYRPAVVYATWLTGGPLMSYLIQYARRGQVALIDQEGGRIGEAPFKRSFTRLKGIRAEVGKVCAKVFSWGNTQAGWLRELGFVPADRIVVTGSPRFDPYLVLQERLATRHLGVTLRGDALTSLPNRLMEHVFFYAQADERDGVSVGYPLGAQFEDKVWHVVATTRCLFKTAKAFSQSSQARIVFRPGPWEQVQQYRFLSQTIASASVNASTPQHEYVRNAFALLEESSSMGLEGLVSRVPVISVHALIPGLKAHLSGEGGGLFSALYLPFYWKPKSVEEAVEMILEAERGRLAATPDPEGAQEYLQEHHGWPRRRPSSFEIGDRLLELLRTQPSAERGSVQPEPVDRMAHLKRAVYRHVPGSVHALKATLLCRQAMSPERALWFRYHYSDVFYPHHQTVRAIFDSLWRMHGMAPRPEPAPMPVAEEDHAYSPNGPSPVDAEGRDAQSSVARSTQGGI